jgi:serine/threonine-protein kinase RsbW
LTVALQIEARPEQLRLLRDFVRAVLEPEGVAETALNPLLVALDEAATNIIMHGYRGGAGAIHLEITSQGETVLFRLRDDAPPFDPTQHPLPNLSLPLEQRPIGGLGVHLMRQTMDGLSYRSLPEGGNELTLYKHHLIPPKEKPIMQIKETQQKGLQIVALFGEFDASSAPEVETLLQGKFATEGSVVILDMSGAPFMSSAGLRVLQKVLYTAKGRGGRIALAEVTPGVQFVLEQTGMKPLFPLYESVEDAVAHLAATPFVEVKTITFVGDLDAASAPALDAEIKKEVASGKHHLVLDLSGVPYIASAGFRAIQGGLMACRSYGGDLRIAGMIPAVRQVFDTLGFTPLFHVYDEAPSAVASFH